MPFTVNPAGKFRCFGDKFLGPVFSKDMLAVKKGGFKILSREIFSDGNKANRFRVTPRLARRRPDRLIYFFQLQANRF